MHSNEARELTLSALSQVKEQRQKDFVDGPGANLLSKIAVAAKSGLSNIIVPYSAVENEGLILLGYMVVVRDNTDMKVSW